MGSRGANSSIKSKESNNTNRKDGYVVINQMIQDDIVTLKEQLKEYRKKSSEAFHNWYDFRRSEHPELTDEQFGEEKRKRHNEYLSFERDNRGLNSLNDMSDARLEKAVKDHYEGLQAKVEKKIGKIKYIIKTGNNGYNYRMENAKGESVAVQVIGAGGYNVQRYHTRWIIKK